MTLKRRARDARFSTRRLDSDRGPGRRHRRHERQIDWTETPQATLDEWFVRACKETGVFERTTHAFEETEARDEGMDGLHPDEAP